ncbi:MAG: Type 4 prepilin-like protein leader peptide-processing enzyme [Parcubacteria group bacterium GW2011_GWA2_40_8]|nr:MAG: Type 4 prepilin-like protein leader peptide-processing enzyme [Parcubacteria group bacterium GW2011_GWA2_40_8]
MFALSAVFSFVFGAIAGSFIDAASERWGQDKSIMGRSHCVSCGYVLKWKDLFPVFSFLALRGRCASCGVNIPRRHLIIEIITGFIFFVIFLSLPLSKYIFVTGTEIDLILFANLLFLWVVTSAILILILSDARFYIIPDIVSMPGALAVLILAALLDYVFPNIDSISFLAQEGVNNIFSRVIPSFPESLLGATIGSLFFFSISFISRGKWMGWGDGKMAMFLGALFGWPFVVSVAFASFVLGSFVGLFLMLKKEATMKSLLPFGVFLGISAIFFLIFQNTSDGQMFRFFSSSFFAL